MPVLLGVVRFAMVHDESNTFSSSLRNA